MDQTPKRSSVGARLQQAVASAWDFIRPDDKGVPTDTFDPKNPNEFNEIGERLDIRGLFLLLRGGWKLIACCIAAGVLLSAFALLRSPAVYQATMSVAPANNAETQASSLLQGSPVASLLGQAPVSQQFQIFQSMIKSPQVAAELDRRYHISRRLFAESWDSERHVWRAPHTVKLFLKSILYNLFGMSAWAPPDAVQLSGYLGSQIQVVPDGVNVYQISYSYTDPKFAQWFLGAVVQLADARTLQVTKNTTRAQLRHLQESLDSTASVEFRQAIVGAFVNKQYQSLMAVEGLPFALTILSPSSVSSQPVSPKPPLYLVAGAVLGTLAGVVLLFARRMLFRI